MSLYALHRRFTRSASARRLREIESLPLADGRTHVPKSPAFSEFEAPRRAVANVPKDVSDALLRVVKPKGAAPRTEPRPDPVPAREPYFEIYRADRVSLTSILFSGGDWRWRYCAASGEPIAISAGYASEQACTTAVASLRSGAGTASVRTGPSR